MLVKLKDSKPIMIQKCKGAVLPLVALMLVALVSILALMIELNWLNSSRFQAQSASDLGSRSALAALHNNTGALNQRAVKGAKKIGADILNLNSPGGQFDATDITFGDTNELREFNAITKPSDFRDITASRVDVVHPVESLLGTLMVKEDIKLNVLSVSEATRIELVICLDASRSMNILATSTNTAKDKEFPPGGRTINEPPLPGSRWFALRDAVDGFFSTVAKAGGSSRLALVSFGGGSPKDHRVESPLDDTLSRTEFSLGSFGGRSRRLASKLEEYGTYPALGLGTSIYDGLDDSIDVLTASSTPSEQSIILFTDGFQSKGVDRPDELIAARRAKDEGITVYTVGYAVSGDNLKEIARITGGKAFIVSTPEGLNTAFIDIAKLFKVRLTK